MEVTNNVMMLRKTVSGDKANNGVNRANIYQQTKKTIACGGSIPSI
jgi:hypothetical protein